MVFSPPPPPPPPRCSSGLGGDLGLGWCGWPRPLSSSLGLLAWGHDPAAPSPSGDVVKPFLLLLLLPWLCLGLCHVPPAAAPCPAPAGRVSRVYAKTTSVPGSVSVPGGRRRLIRWLPSHSSSWPPQGQNPFDLEFDQSNHLEPVFNFECPPRPGELRALPVPSRGAASRVGSSSRAKPRDVGLLRSPEGFGGAALGVAMLGDTVGHDGGDSPPVALLRCRHAFKSTHRHP